MVQALDSEGSPVLATVFSAIVAKERFSDTIQFQLGDENSVDVLMNGEQVVFDEIATQQFNNVTVTKLVGHTASAVFSSGVYIEVRAANEILSTLLVSLPETYVQQTTGLVGNFNGEQSDDLRPLGQSSPLPLTSSLQEIHNLFGITCKLNFSLLSMWH